MIWWCIPFSGCSCKEDSITQSFTLSFWHIQEEGIRGSQAVLRMLDLKHAAEVRWPMSSRDPEGDRVDFKLDSERYRYPVPFFQNLTYMFMSWDSAEDPSCRILDHLKLVDQDLWKPC